MAGSRKRLKRKRRSCALCKPEKTGGAVRWTHREQSLLTEWERERLDWEHGAYEHEVYPYPPDDDE